MFCQTDHKLWRSGIDATNGQGRSMFVVVGNSIDGMFVGAFGMRVKSMGHITVAKVVASNSDRKPVCCSGKFDPQGSSQWANGCCHSCECCCCLV